MRIMAVCNNCQRSLLLSQLVEGPEITGRCPWCGTEEPPSRPVVRHAAQEGGFAP
jgi:hypothetical protein